MDKEYVMTYEEKEQRLKDLKASNRRVQKRKKLTLMDKEDTVVDLFDEIVNNHGNTETNDEN